MYCHFLSAAHQPGENVADPAPLHLHVLVTIPLHLVPPILHFVYSSPVVPLVASGDAHHQVVAVLVQIRVVLDLRVVLLVFLAPDALVDRDVFISCSCQC